jgi:regulator of cell morphogenesis and NO signaling
MTTFDVHRQIGQLVAERPARSRVFDRHGLDYCCGGKRTIEDACRRRGVDPDPVLADLAALDAEVVPQDDPIAGMSMTELADHIEVTHHAYLRSELPRLTRLVAKVTAVHGATHAWLEEVQTVYAGLVAELEPHMMKEEQILFPMIREIEKSGSGGAVHCGTIENPIRVMEHEHDNAGEALERLRTLTNGFAIPEGACNSFRAMLDGLETLESDLHQHIHKENNVLFVQAAQAATGSIS